MPEYQSNSHSKKELPAEAKERKVEKVVKGKVKVKNNNGRKLAGLFISEDASNVKNYVFMDVLVPAIKKAISDIVRDGIDMVLYGESGRSRSGGRSRSDDRPSYRSYYDDRRNRDRDRDHDRDRGRGSRFDYDDLIFDTRADAEFVKDGMLDDIERYGMVSVSTMYDLAGVTAPYTAHSYGWMGLRYIEVKRVRDGFILQLPKAMPID
ncbi:MAG: hypothetical protein J6B01_04530 [Ruminococcus sp.]|nr:hypothetical protein [Ruminococcus sp.]